MNKIKYMKPDTAEQVDFLPCSILADSNPEGIEDITVIDPVNF